MWFLIDRKGFFRSTSNPGFLLSSLVEIFGRGEKGDRMRVILWFLRGNDVSSCRKVWIWRKWRVLFDRKALIFLITDFGFFLFFMYFYLPIVEGSVKLRKER